MPVCNSESPSDTTPYRATESAALAEVFLTQALVARRYQVSPATIERWRAESRGPAYLKLPGGVRYREQDLLEFEAACLRSGTTD